MKKYIFAILFILAAATIGFLAWGYFTLTESQISDLVAEDGPIEFIQPWIYFAAALLGLMTAWVKRSRLWGVFTFLMLVAGAREMDLHKAYTADSVLKIKFYTTDIAPLHEKAAGLVFILLLLFCVIYLIWKIFTERRRLSLNNLSFVTALCGFGTLGFAKMLDSFARLFPLKKRQTKPLRLMPFATTCVRQK